MSKTSARGMSNWTLIGIALLPAAVLLNWVAGYFPVLVEKTFANGLNRFTVRLLSLAAGFFPFSVGEFLVLILLVSLISYGAVKLLRYKRKTGIKAPLRKVLLKILAILGAVYALFIILWGLNYQRLSFAEIAGLPVRPAEARELGTVCHKLINRANTLRTPLPRGVNGAMYLQRGKKEALKQAQAGYDAAAVLYPELGGSYGRPKGIFWSEYMSYLGLSGVYSPFTGEANVNLAFPDALVPATICHEMAHQRGFAREDEANYIAYLTCNYNPDREFQYSGTLLALLHSMAALKVSSPAEYIELEKQVSPEIQADLAEYYSYWRMHEGLAAKISSRTNDLFLKSNLQSDGIQSYGRMVDLLIAEDRSGREPPPVND